MILIFASAFAAEALPIEELNLEDLLSEEIRGGEAGSFGKRLSELNIRAEVHGYVSAEVKSIPLPWNSEESTPTFDLHHQVLNVRASPHERVELESQIEWEHAGQDFYVPLAQIDVIAHQALIIRAGYFATPFGAFNEYQYPDFLRKTAQQPQFTREVVPSLWSEVGLQLRGNVPLGGSSVNYAVFSSNGLEQRDSDPDDGIIEEGGSIRDMRNNARDKNHADKAFGGRLGGSFGEAVEVGLSGYTGAYTTDGAQRLSMVGADLTATPGKLTIRAEGAVARQQITDGVLTKSGGYVMVAYRATGFVEPYVWFEVVDVDAGDAGRQMGPLAGVLMRPMPKSVVSLQLKLEANTLVAADGTVSGQGISQLVLSF